MIRSLSSRISKRILSSVIPCYGNASCFSMVLRQPYRSSTLWQIFYKSQRNTIPCDFLKWGSLGSIRTSKFASGFSPLKPKPLDSIIDMERAKNKSAEELADVWDDYHLGRGHIAASMKAKLYKLFEQRSSSCRYFVIPLWRGSGYTTMFVQVQAPHMLITGLEDYKARGTQASPYFTVSYYTEFAESKDLVLVRGDIVFTSKLTDSEAKWLLDTAQSFYLNDVRYKLVECFNRETREFEFKDVLQTLEMPIL
ncbi:uncharacterized protein LOC107787395 isoform X1 [Nicotiana tabacum]|uniref:ATP synthase mitochondrial F1 complex assembly factor 1-like isoform X1 n=4 Tax=Nicotiana TaxID=4085 RepID=A0A1S3ZJE7_TOBAC|nr:PREDICTED: ATP synthase mitochondrial F1 complex assembly factor 1 isoform X1 [Nicotiana sylvestris]XP_009774286.1 PREDICTED: ATP synthase mitochondrial F1 complex assembly factor 1 isoform X1 [Nicotiana sylvestris]XP_016464441.1 PREDICTED: ATP synthase mitochondrial F1 complex assembly factor 1-like isoform X1 [Nicotiana tabacum]XP_016464442.1 PREDICTED: ATP synthase mitochondrial F1 complex assembly factor 1-like isoform X1 [Nicotiana tabacum]